MAEGTENSIPNVVSIAGVDPSGGAGVLADVKAMSACGAYACGVIAALTAQNTQTVTGVMPVPATFLKEQIDTLFDDVRIDAVKIGMLGTVEQIETVADALVRRKPRFVVLDPVMVAKGGSRLLAADAVDALKERLLPLATIITPNLPEAMCLLGREEDVTEEEFPEVARELWKLLGRRNAWVYLKGGHLEGESAYDLLFNNVVSVPFTAPRVPTKNTHGTGCTLSSAIAAFLPRPTRRRARRRPRPRSHEQLLAPLEGDGVKICNVFLTGDWGGCIISILNGALAQSVRAEES